MISSWTYTLLQQIHFHIYQFLLSLNFIILDAIVKYIWNIYDLLDEANTFSILNLHNELLLHISLQFIHMLIYKTTV